MMEQPLSPVTADPKHLTTTGQGPSIVSAFVNANKSLSVNSSLKEQHREMLPLLAGVGILAEM